MYINFLSKNAVKGFQECSDIKFSFTNEKYWKTQVFKFPTFKIKKSLYYYCKECLQEIRAAPHKWPFRHEILKSINFKYHVIIINNIR